MKLLTLSFSLAMFGLTACGGPSGGIPAAKSLQTQDAQSKPACSQKESSDLNQFATHLATYETGKAGSDDQKNQADQLIPQLDQDCQTVQAETKGGACKVTISGSARIISADTYAATCQAVSADAAQLKQGQVPSKDITPLAQDASQASIDSAAAAPSADKAATGSGAPDSAASQPSGSQAPAPAANSQTPPAGTTAATLPQPRVKNRPAGTAPAGSSNASTATSGSELAQTRRAKSKVKSATQGKSAAKTSQTSGGTGSVATSGGAATTPKTQKKPLPGLGAAPGQANELNSDSSRSSQEPAQQPTGNPQTQRKPRTTQTKKNRSTTSGPAETGGQSGAAVPTAGGRTLQSLKAEHLGLKLIDMSALAQATGDNGSGQANSSVLVAGKIVPRASVVSMLTAKQTNVYCSVADPDHILRLSRAGDVIEGIIYNENSGKIGNNPTRVLSLQLNPMSIVLNCERLGSTPLTLPQINQALGGIVELVQR